MVVALTLPGQGVAPRCQDGPLLPWIFNTIIDELLEMLPWKHRAECGGQRLDAVTYADDLVLYADSLFGMETVLRHVCAFMANRGLKLNSTKCWSLSIIVTGKVKKTAFLTKSPFLLEGVRLRCHSVWARKAPTEG